MTGEEAARLWVQKFWLAVVLSHLPICWFPCWVTKGVVARTMSVPDEERCLFFSKAPLKIKQGQTEGPGCTSGIWSEVVELKVGWEGHVLPW